MRILLYCFFYVFFYLLSVKVIVKNESACCRVFAAAVAVATAIAVIADIAVIVANAAAIEYDL